MIKLATVSLMELDVLENPRIQFLGSSKTLSLQCSSTLAHLNVLPTVNAVGHDTLLEAFGIFIG